MLRSLSCSKRQIGCATLRAILIYLRNAARRLKGKVPLQLLGHSMKTVYVSNTGNDRNDGFSPDNAVHSWKRTLRLQGGDNAIDIHVTGEAAKRITKEIVKRALAISRQSLDVILCLACCLPTQ